MADESKVRSAQEIIEEWAGVCSIKLSEDPSEMVSWLAEFIDSKGLTAELEDHLRGVAEQGASDPAAE